MKPRVPPPIVLLLAAALAGALHHWLPIAQWLTAPWTRVGALPALLGIGIAGAAASRFRAAQTTINPLDPSKATRLVTGGVFRWSRNPMYLGLLLVLVGWSTWLGSASCWVVPPLFVALLTALQIRPEEQALSRLFGAEYAAYRAQVGRWIGRRG